MRFVTGHAAGMIGADGVDVAVLMVSMFQELYKHTHDGQDKDDFYQRRNALKRNPMIVPDKRNRTIRYTGMIPLLYSRHIPVSRSSEIARLQMFSTSFNFIIFNF